MGSFSNPHISKCSMMPKWHQIVPMSGDVRESETEHCNYMRLQGVLLCQLDYNHSWLFACYFLSILSSVSSTAKAVQLKIYPENYNYFL